VAVTSRRRVLAALAASVVPRPGISASGRPRVAVGLEVLEAEKGGALRGRSVGLLAHAPSVTANGRHAIDVLQDAGVKVKRLFGPEHGLRGEAAAGETVDSGVDPKSGLPVVSLYGKKRKPAPRDLEGLDALVVDMQGAGVRFYTYGSTLLLCLEVAGETGLDVWVLDRPNPLGGDLIEGPERDPGEPVTLVSMAPGPLVHGLTLGELGRFAAAEGGRPSRVHVVPMAGWSREMRWPDTGRHWVRPSPNLRTDEAALVYPGTCLLEGTNVSEGRGTTDPFLMFGAPWLRSEPLLAELSAPGLAFETVRFTPSASSAARRPRHEGTPCEGVRIRVTDASRVRPYAFGLELLAALRRRPEFAWEGEGARLDTLLGTRKVRAALDRGETVSEILAADAPAVERFTHERRGSLLY